MCVHTCVHRDRIYRCKLSIIAHSTRSRNFKTALFEYFSSFKLVSNITNLQSAVVNLYRKVPLWYRAEVDFRCYKKNSAHVLALRSIGFQSLNPENFLCGPKWAAAHHVNWKRCAMLLRIASNTPEQIVSPVSGVDAGMSVGGWQHSCCTMHACAMRAQLAEQCCNCRSPLCRARATANALAPLPNRVPRRLADGEVV